LDPETNNERLPVWNHPFNWNDVLAIFRKVFPKRNFVNDLKDQGKFLGTVDELKSKALLKKWSGQDDWISFEIGMTEMALELEALEREQ